MNPLKDGMMLNLFKLKPFKDLSIIKEVLAAHKPYFFWGEKRWRYESMEKTLNCVMDPNELRKLQLQAESNLNQWAQEKIPSPNLVEVVYKDWGLATLEATKKHGVPYSVLNMANPIFPGGAVLEGGNAQEEDMWHRSTCAQSLLDGIIYLNKDSMRFYYNETAVELLEGKVKMTDEDLETLNAYGGKQDSSGHIVLFSHEPRICFRGPEVPRVASGFEDTGNHPDKQQSYQFLPPSDVFPFYELRSAAPDISSGSPKLDIETWRQYKVDLQRRIAAQLDTLILQGKRNVILGAWGCGRFKNDPNVVAQIYAEEIEKRAHLFDHILFPIIDTGAHDNHVVFEQQLNGMRLGKYPSYNPTARL